MYRYSKATVRGIKMQGSGIVLALILSIYNILEGLYMGCVIKSPDGYYVDDKITGRL